MPLKDFKASYPIETAKYAVTNKISMEPSFSWRVTKVLKMRNRIIGKINSRYWLKTHIYGIEVPRNWKEAVEIDRNNGNTLSQDAVGKEMKTVRPALEVRDGEEKDLVGFTRITGYIIYTVKLGKNFKRKARYVVDGYKTDPPSTLTYASVVSRDSVRLFFLIASLNGLDAAYCDIEGAYSNADCREKVYII